VAAGLALRAAAAHPGYSATNITAATNQSRNPVKDYAVHIGNALFGLPPARGAEPTLMAATSPAIRGGEFIGISGPFELWGAPGPVRPAPLARDPALAAELWSRSEAWTGVQFAWPRPAAA
jgi:hypothetical protein